MLVLYEWKKLWRVRYLQVLFVVLLVVQAGLSVYHVRQNAEPTSPYLREVYDDYAADPARVQQLWEAAQAEQERVMSDFMASIDSGLPIDAVYTHTYTDRVADYYLLDDFFRERARAEAYPDTVRELVRAARRNQSTMHTFSGGAEVEQSWAWRYQERLIAVYEPLSEKVSTTPAYISGWGAYFSDQWGDYLLVAFLLAMAGAAVLSEKSSGFYPILCTTSRGFRRTMGAKLAAAWVTTLVAVAAFSAVSFGAVALGEGFAGAGQPIQHLEAFVYCPYALRIGQYALLRLLCRALAMSAFVSVAVLLSAATYRGAVMALGGGVLLAGSLAAQLFGGHTGWTLTGLFSVTDPAAFFTRFQAVNLAGAPVSLLPLTVCGYAVLTIGCAGGALWVAGRRHAAGYDRVHTRRRRECPGKNGKLRQQPANLWSYECRKLFPPVAVTLLLVALAVKGVWSAREFATEASYGDEVYHEYMDVMEGEFNDDNAAWIAEEVTRLRTIIATQEQRYQAYLSGEMTRSEYEATLDQYAYANARVEHAGRAAARMEYLAALRDERGVTGWALYDTGWLATLSRGWDWLLAAVLLCLTMRAFSMEYRVQNAGYPFASILRTTPRGRGETFFSKYAVVMVGALALSLLFLTVDGVLSARGRTLPCADAPLYSLPRYGQTMSGITLSQYALLVAALRLWGALLLTAQTLALAQLLKKPARVLLAAAALFFAPRLLSQWATAFAYVDITRLLSGDELWRLSIAAPWGGDAGLLLVTVAGFTALTAGLIALSRRQFCKEV